MRLKRREFLSIAAMAGGLSGLDVQGAEAIDGDFSMEDKVAGKTAGTELDFLMQYSTTTLESAVTLILGGHDKTHVTLPGLIGRFAHTARPGRLVGYAVTSEYSTDPDDQRGRRENLDYYQYVFDQPGPKVAISTDLSARPGSGSSWGRVNANIHKALGCRGMITNGGARDIEEIEKIGFQVYSTHLTVGHGVPHFIGFGGPVEIHGAVFRSGDIVCADQHGAVIIPKEALPHIKEAVAEGERRVSPVLAYCQSPGFTPAGLVENQRKHMKDAPAWRPKSS